MSADPTERLGDTEIELTATADEFMWAGIAASMVVQILEADGRTDVIGYDHFKRVGLAIFENLSVALAEKGCTLDEITEWNQQTLALAAIVTQENR